jgi:hypothetical protein
MKTLLLAATMVAALTTTTHAAQMWFEDRAFFIRGDIVRGDEEQFKKLVTKYKQPRGTMVVLKSDGGKMVAGLNIGLAIRALQYRTLAVDECVSVCAFMWLAGQPRSVFDNASIGFHGVYTKKDDGTVEAARSGNALAGAYLARLGFSYDAIEYMTHAGPDEAEWLDNAKAKKYNIQVAVLKSKQPTTTNLPTVNVTSTAEMPKEFYGEWCGDGGASPKGTLKVTKGGNTEGSVRCDLRAAKQQQGEKGSSWALTFKCSDSKELVKESGSLTTAC